MILPNLLVTIAYFLMALIEFGLLTRFILRLSAADPFNYFINWIYAATSPLVAPFEGLFGDQINANGSVLEVSTLIAMLAFLIIFYLITGFFRLFVSPYEVIEEDE